MSTLTDMQAAAHTKLRLVASRPKTVWPNDSTSEALPRLEVFDGPVISEVLFLDGTSQINFSLQVDVVVEAGAFSAEQRGFVKMIENAFLVGDAVGSDAEVSGRPTPQGYRQDGTEYRCSVTIPMTGILGLV